MRAQICKPFDARYLNLELAKKEREAYEAYGKCGSIVNRAARLLGRDVSSISKAVRSVQDKGSSTLGHLTWDEYLEEIIDEKLNILIYDIETTYNLAAVWDFYGQNIGHNQIIQYGWMISFAAKWIGSEKIIYEECRTKTGNDKPLVKKLMALLDRADMVIAHNGRAYDTKSAKGRALKYGLKPPSPFKVADTMLIAKNEFKLPRNSLEYLAEHVGVTPKSQHKTFPGMEMWKECRKGNPKAWKEMREYNIQDVLTLEEVYYALRPWATQHPNLGIFLSDTRSVCPKCGSPELKNLRKPVSTNTQKYQGYECKNCGGIARGRHTITTKEKRKSLIVNAV